MIPQYKKKHKKLTLLELSPAIFEAGLWAMQHQLFFYQSAVTALTTCYRIFKQVQKKLLVDVNQKSDKLSHKARSCSLLHYEKVILNILRYKIKMKLIAYHYYNKNHNLGFFLNLQ